MPDADEADLTSEAQAALDRQLAQTHIDASAFELVARVEPFGIDGLKLSVVCFARSDRGLRAQVQVTGHGPRKKLIGSMIAKAARDLSAECR